MRLTNSLELLKKLSLLLVFIVALVSLSKPALAREINTIIVHHSASPDVSAETINQWHKANGWSGIGYHYVIRANGDVEVGRPINKVGAHAKGRNKGSAGICLTGYSEFTPNQKIALGILVRKLCGKYPVLKIERHHEECPGKGLEVEAMSKEILGDRYQIGVATYFKDWSTASGVNMYLQPSIKGCASWFYPLGSNLKVTNLNTGKFVIVRVIDRGPNKKLVALGRIVDLSPAAFKVLAPLSEGKIEVRVERLS